MEMHCNICQGKSFIPGPYGRLSLSGEPPACDYCGSLERHRILRQVWSHIPKNYLIDKTALQFSLDPSVEPSWFKEHEVSIYGHQNSIDIQHIDRKDHSFDIIICNQILEHVEQDRKAFQELIRILNPEGFLQMTVPNPIMRKTTEDWGYPKKEFHGHYRHYGIDLIERFTSEVPAIHMICVKSKDVITDTEDYVFFWGKSENAIQILKKNIQPEFDIPHQI